MSNAMRFGKRSLAGVAAGALAAGALAIAAAPSASANTGASIEFSFPSITVIGSAQNAATGIIAPLEVYDVNGDQITTGTLSNQIVEVSVTEPPIFTDDSIGVALTADDTAISNTSNDPVELGAMRVGIRAGGTPTWNQLVGQTKTGTYTITARLVNSLNGTIVQTKTMPFTLVAAAGAPAGNVSWVREGNLVNQVGFTADDSIFHGLAPTAGANSQDDSISIYLSDSRGGPYLMSDDSVAWTVWSTGTASNTAATGTIGGWLGAGSATTLGIYQLNPGLINTTGPAGTGTLTGTSAPAGTAIASGTLPVQIASIKTGNAPTVTLSNADSYGVPNYDDSYQVPAGTKELTFSIATTGGFDDSTIAYNATVTNTVTGTAAGQVLTSFGGRTAIKSDQGTLTIALNEAAQVAGTQVNVQVGRWNEAGKTTLVQINVANPAATVFSTPGLAKVSSDATIPGTVTTQFGGALPGTWTARLKSGTVAAANCSANTTIGTPVVASAAGAFTLTAPAAYAATTNGGTSTFTICADNGFGSFAALPVTVTYTTTGGVTSMTLTTAGITGVTQTSAARPLVKVPPSGTASLTQVAASSSIPGTSLTEAQVIAAGQAFTLTANVTPNTTVNFKGTDGVRFTNRIAGSVFWSDAETSLDVLSTSNAAAASVIATKPGIHTVTVTAGTTTQTYTFRAEVSTQGARTITADPTALNLATNQFKELSVTVKDIYGNTVPRVSSTSTGATLANTLAGGGTVSSLVTGGSIAATDAAGKTSVTYTAPAGTGDARVGWVLAGGQVDVPIAGAPETVKLQNVNIIVGGAPITKSIVIVGERTTVSGKPGIRVEGDTTGIADGVTVKPWVRFPGQSDYTVGSARPKVDAAGDFSWQRKTGKKTYVFFTTDDEAVKSNRVIIPAN